MRLILLSVLLVWAISAQAQAPKELDDAVRAVCPQIDGVSIGKFTDRATWIVHFQAGATCQAAAATVVSAFAFSQVPLTAQTISNMQAKVALSRAGLLAAVQAWVNTQSAETQLIWNTTPGFSRNSTLIANGAAALGLTSAQLDQLFITAATIQP
jgi:hypothetical protein